MFSNHKIFEQYLDSSYSRGNILSTEQYEKACKNFENLYTKFLPKDKNAKILDIGCGAGHFLYFLAKKKYKNCLGIDISKQQISACEKIGLDNVYIANATDFLKEKINFYDAISAHDVIEHFNKQNQLIILEKIYKSLKPGGIFIARVPNLSNPFSIDSRYSDITHETGFTSKSLYQILWICGFRDIKILPPIKIRVASFRNFVRKLLVLSLQGMIRLSYYVQDFTVPENLDKNLTVISIKNEKSFNYTLS